MKLFRIPAGTPIKVHDNSDRTIATYRTEDRVAKREMTFEVEDIRIDPVGLLGTHRGWSCHNTIGGHWARCGFYGFGFRDDNFGRTGWTVLVPVNAVEIM